MENTKNTNISVINFCDNIDYSENSIVSKRILEKKTGNISLFAFDKGQSLSEHTAPFDALVQVLEGTAEIQINKVAYKLNNGESIIMPANIPHAVNAAERFKMLLTMIKEPI
jgi:quercetin dioxygenase-like cupin family protein